MSDELELLAHGDEGPGLLERCRQRVIRGRVGRGVHQHPRLTAAGCAAAIASSAVLGYVILVLPPSVDPSVRLEIDPVGFATSLAATVHGDDAWLGSEATPTFSGGFRLSTDVEGDVVRVVGVVGPGLTAPAFTGPEVTAGAPVPGRSTAEPDCSARGWATATDADYRLRVNRTDAYGRRTEADLPVGGQAAGWRALVRRECLRHLVAHLPADQWKVDARPGWPEVALTVRIHNEHEYALWVRAADAADHPASGALVPVAPGGVATLRVPSVVTDCTDPTLGSLYQDRRGRYFLPLHAVLGDSPRAARSDDDILLAGLPVSAPLVAALRLDVSLACRGAPPTTAEVTAVRPVGTDGQATGWRVDVRFRTTADSVAVGAGALGAAASADLVAAYDDPSERWSAPTRVVDGTAQAVLTWSLPACVALEDDSSFGPPGPPGALVVTMVGGRRYPQWLGLPDAMLLTALRRACPGVLTDPGAASLGWRTAR